MEIEKTKYKGIYFAWKGKRKILLTKSLDNKSYFGERLIDGYREFIPNRSKLAASIVKGIAVIPIKERDIVLYLGAAQGQTASYISDIVGRDGFVFCVEISPRACRELLYLVEQRKNMTAMLADAAHPESYKNNIARADVLYQDIAQKNQVEIFLKNIELFLKPKGYAIVAIKTRSIDVTKSPKAIFNDVKTTLEKKLKIIDVKDLSPLQKDHYFLVCQKK
ncbi:MAG: fibrillarin-like rRNA/tRNA 2'-O-methyltransferase [Nanoarchaeota archaeon]